MNKCPFLKIQFVLTALCLSALLLTNSGCNRKKHEKEETKYLVTSPLKTDQNLMRSYVAQINAHQHIELRAFERGYLQNILVDEGQLVKKGEKIFELMPAIKKAEFNKAKAEVDLAEIEYKNAQSLARKKVVSKNEVALSKARYDKVVADLDLAKLRLDFTEIKAPFDGLIVRFKVRLGSLLEEGELLSTLSDNSTVWVYFNVSESDYLDIKTGENGASTLPVHLKMANGKMFKFEGKIDTIEADFNNETGNIAFRASFPNPEGLLRHGETGSVEVPFPVKGALVIPQKSTFEILDKKFVYILDENYKVKSHEITIADELPHLYIVSSGLKETDKIILDGIGKVELGQKISPDYQDPKKVISTLNLPAE